MADISERMPSVYLKEAEMTKVTFLGGKTSLIDGEAAGCYLALGIKLTPCNDNNHLPFWYHLAPRD